MYLILLISIPNSSPISLSTHKLISSPSPTTHPTIASKYPGQYSFINALVCIKISPFAVNTVISVQRWIKLFFFIFFLVSFST